MPKLKLIVEFDVTDEFYNGEKMKSLRDFVHTGEAAKDIAVDFMSNTKVTLTENE